jgi:hypothetical protein
MSCETQPSGLSHLGVKSSIDVHKCKLHRGTSARHSVHIKNYALVEIEVEIECGCPAGVGLAHACGNPWQPQSRALTASGGRVVDTTFDEQLCAPHGAGQAGTQQLMLTIRRRPLRAAKWTSSTTTPLTDIEVA